VEELAPNVLSDQATLQERVEELSSRLEQERSGRRKEREARQIAQETIERALAARGKAKRAAEQALAERDEAVAHLEHALAQRDQALAELRHQREAEAASRAVPPVIRDAAVDPQIARRRAPRLAAAVALTSLLAVTLAVILILSSH
jgi:uncharacterized membrane protein YccC